MADTHGRLFKPDDEMEIDLKGTGDYELNTLNMEPNLRKTPSTSRFLVARVNVIDENQEIKDSEDVETSREKPNHINFNIPDSPKDRDIKCPYDSPTFYAATSSPTDTFVYHNSFTSPYETNLKTFGRNTTEALPHVDHYRNLLSATEALKLRPTLAQLHDEKDEEEKGKQSEPLLSSQEKLADESHKGKSTDNVIKFGWVKGVLIRCLLNIWGVMLFLRMSWVVGQAGVGFTTLIILLSAVVTTITSISMSAICTNGEVKGGGAYYMISRSLGPEYGGAIGLIFSVANAVAIAMYVVGFSETVRDLLKTHNALMVDEVNDIRIIGALTVTLLLAIAIVGMEWEARAQVILLVALLLAIANFFIGTFIPPSEKKVEQGVVGYRGDVFVENLTPQYEQGENFFSVFAIFFPAATGILAGANISGDLKNAQRDIPKGTFIAIIISSVVYIVVAWMLGGCILREASGFLPGVIAVGVNSSGVIDLSNLTDIRNNSSIIESASQTSGGADIYSLARNCSFGENGACQTGLLHNFQVMEVASAWGPLVTLGIFSATLSSALASLVSAPKVFQAVCKDKIFPKIHIFAKGYGANDNPRRAYILAYFIGLAFICIGDLNAIAPIISNFFLMSYALINYSCFDASLARSPGWRPAFKYYSKWCSLLGALLCIAVMFIINWWTALITFAVVSALFVYVHYTKPDVNWGSSTQAHVYRSALQSSLKLVSVKDHIKNFRPQVLVLTGLPKSRPALVDFVYTLTRKISLMVCGHVMLGNQSEHLKDMKKTDTNEVYRWLQNRRVKSFYNVTTAPTFRDGVQSLMQNVGVGKLRPNILIMGFMSSWNDPDTDHTSVDEYFNIIHDAFDLQYGVGILRLQEGLYCETNPDDSNVSDKVQHKGDPDGDDDEDNIAAASSPGTPTMLRRDSASSSGTQGDATEASTPETALHKGVSVTIEKLRNRFAKKQKSGTIDVWWLFDDGGNDRKQFTIRPCIHQKHPEINILLGSGISLLRSQAFCVAILVGLTLLLPYILTTKTYWKNSRLRVFAAGTKRGEIDREQRQMATLLSRFRIQCEKMTILADIGKSPKEESMKEFDKIIEGCMLNEEAGETKEKYPWKITEEDKLLLKDKTKRNVRIRELLQEHSMDASLIVMTLPMPRKGTCPSGLYMAWVDTLTKNLPPILLVRGNQSSVLTFYS